MNLTDSDTSRLSRRQVLAGGAALTAGVGGEVLAAREYSLPGELQKHKLLHSVGNLLV